MPKLDFDFVEDLKTAGASHELAQAILRVVSEKQVAQLATKADLVETRETLRTEMAETRETLRGEMSALELRLTEKMTAMQTKLILWMIGIAIGIVALVAGIFQLMK